MNNKNRYKIMALASVLIISILVLASLAQTGEIFSNSKPSNDQYGSGAGSLGAAAARTDEQNPIIIKQTMTTFSTGATRVTALGKPEGETVYLALPPEANVTSAVMDLQGRMPGTVNRFSVDGRLNFIQGADFNQDGYLDVFTLDKNNQSLHIILNDKAGHLSSSKGYVTGDMPLHGTIDDLNNDGYPDTACANEGANSITVYQNSGTGDGTLTNRKDYKIGDWPRAMTSADFNNDGWIDIATITSNDDKLWLHLNDKKSTISFSQGSNYTTTHSPVGIASGDLNNDGSLDLAVINLGANLSSGEFRYYYSVSVFINKGNAEFELERDYHVGKNPAGVIINDLNNDGWQDIATSNRGSYNVSVLLNKGGGNFSNSINYSLTLMSYSGRNLHSGDLDGDGYMDIVSLCSKMNTISVLRNRGDGTFEDYIDYPVPGRPADIFLGDFDKDGDLDVATCSQYDGSVSVVPNKGDGTFSTFNSYAVGTWPRSIIRVDIDDDSDLDLVTANYKGGSLSIMYNDGKGVFGERFDKKIAVEPFSLTVGDFDNDGLIDLGSADEALFKIVLMFNDGGGKFSDNKISYDIGGYPYSIIFKDLNNDGYDDLVTCNNAQLSVSILINLQNGTFAPAVDYSFDNYHPFGLEAGDVDGDGDNDIICTNYGIDTKIVESSISIILNDGNGTFSSHITYDVGDMPINVKTRDIDLDGDLDILVANMGSNTSTVLLNQENKTFGSRRDYDVGPLPICVELEDLDKDGYPDLVVANQNNDSVSILYNLGDGTFTDDEEYLIGAQPTYIAIADYNEDGNLDIATSNLLTNSISVRLDMHFPGDVKVDIGTPGSPELIYDGQLAKTVTVPDFSDQLSSYLAAHSTEIVYTPLGNRVMIPIKVTADVMGILEMLELKVEYEIERDNDGDNLPDHLDNDDDNDLLPDSWEISFNLDALDPDDANQDNDNDGLTNMEEYRNSTDPTKQDSDNDKLTDKSEIIEHLTDPNKKDTDGDGFSDGEELDEKTDPLDKNDHPEDDPPVPGFETGIFIFAFVILIAIIYSTFRVRQKRKK